MSVYEHMLSMDVLDALCVTRNIYKYMLDITLQILHAQIFDTQIFCVMECQNEEKSH